MKNIISRFAPSPTGFLHIGNFRIALINFLRTKSENGKFILRIDDTDTTRSTEEFVKAIQNDLKITGIQWDIIFRQKDRKQQYDLILKELIDQNLIYECFETPEELELKRKSMLARKMPPIYDRQSLKLTQAEKDDLIKSGRKAHYRLKLDNQEITWIDECHGRISVNINNLSDPIILRSNGEYTYLFPSTIDDIDYNITHIVRGNDHITNTAIQIYIMKLLNSSIPSFAHLPLIKICGSDSKISKRSGGFEIRKILEKIDPIVLMSYLSTVGTSRPIKLYNSISELMKNFNIADFSKADSTIDIKTIESLNLAFIKSCNLEYAREKVSHIQFDELFWNTIKNNISSFEEIEKWHNIIYKSIDISVDQMAINTKIINVAIKYLPEKFDNDNYKNWIEKISKDLGIKKITILTSLRMAITCEKKGPELSKLVDIIGKKNVALRLQKASE
ncbi:glutamate--tRNA ligase [Anaplasmataceae bacterium AB001_6]|nr:glutamate--tRNA ligase [Anaplasmataceae bacterium AB001_6]